MGFADRAGLYARTRVHCARLDLQEAADTLYGR